MYPLSGKLIYNPSETLGYDILETKPYWCILKLDNSICRYYQYWLEKQKIYTNYSVWGAHVSVIRGEEPKENKEAWMFDQNRILNFTYNPENINKNDEYWWINLQECDELMETRLFYGLEPKPRYNFHITIGYMRKLPTRKINFNIGTSPSYEKLCKSKHKDIIMPIIHNIQNKCKLQSKQITESIVNNCIEEEINELTDLIKYDFNIQERINIINQHRKPVLKDIKNEISRLSLLGDKSFIFKSLYNNEQYRIDSEGTKTINTILKNYI